jgi:hypothetical protein
VQVIDSEMKYIKSLPKGGNELDIVGLFKSRYPDVIMKLKDTPIILYDSCAFVMEIKSYLTKKNLEDDLNKLKKISKLTFSAPHVEVEKSTYSGLFIDRPLRILLYFDLSMDYKDFQDVMEKNKEICDIVFIVNNKDNKSDIFFSKNLPAGNWLFKSSTKIKFPDGKIPNKYLESNFMKFENVAFVILLTLIAASIPHPVTIDLTKQFLTIISFAFPLK